MNTKLRMLLPFLLLLCMHEAWAQSQPYSGEINGESTYVVQVATASLSIPRHCYSQ